MIGDAIVPALGSTDVGRRNFDLAPCGLLSTNADGDIVDVNDTFVAMTGFTRDELVGRRTFAQLLSAGGRIYHETHYAPMLRMQGSARGIAVDIVTATRARISVLVNSQVEYDEHGLPALVHTAVFDAADRREYERELLRSKQRAEESETRARALARTLQQTLIPPTPPTIPGLDVAGAYRPARSGDEVGGDFYDVFAVTDDDWVIVIGDVCGKGVEAAVITALARYTLRTAAVGTPRPSRMLYTLNDVLIRNGSDRFVTSAVLRVRSGPTGWAVTVSCAGHPAPLLLRPGSDVEPSGKGGSLLGLLPDANFVDTTLSLLPGDTLLLYTDGVTEARRGDEFYGDERLHAAMETHAGTASSLASGVLSEVLEFQAHDPRDDIAIVAITVPTEL